MPVQTIRGGMYKQKNTCTHCTKEFVANRRYTFCSPQCRIAAQLTLSQAQEGASNNESTIEHTNIR